MKSRDPVAFVSGHLDLTSAEFEDHYVPSLGAALARSCSFVVGDARGCDRMAQQWLFERGARATIYHMLEAPRYNEGRFPARGGFETDDDRDAAMTRASTFDVLWVRPGREGGGTARNRDRRRSEAIASGRGIPKDLDSVPVVTLRPPCDLVRGTAASRRDPRPIASALEEIRAARAKLESIPEPSPADPIEVARYLDEVEILCLQISRLTAPIVGIQAEAPEDIEILSQIASEIWCVDALLSRLGRGQ